MRRLSREGRMCLLRDEFSSSLLPPKYPKGAAPLAGVLLRTVGMAKGWLCAWEQQEFINNSVLPEIRIHHYPHRYPVLFA